MTAVLRYRFVAAGLALVLLVGAGLAIHKPGAGNPGSEARQAAFVAIGLLACAVYFTSIAWLLRTRPRLASPPALALVLAVAVAMRLIALAGPPFLSTDLYRYIWDGRVQSAGFNPYVLPPADPALRSLRDGVVYPRINRVETARTIYPPVAELLFRAVAAVSETPLAMKLAMLGFDLLAIAVLLRLLALAGLERSRVLIYAWNPLAVWEFAGNAHVDAALVGFLALAMLAHAAGRRAWTGAALAAAVLIKFFPAALFPAFWRRAARRDWQMPAAMAAVIVGAYALFIDAGSNILGFLPGYVAEENLESGGGIFWIDGLAQLMALPPRAGRYWLAAVAIGLGALALSMILRDRPPSQARHPVPLARDLCVMGAAVIVAVTPHYPWYFVWLALPACLAPFPSVIFLSAVSILQYHDPFQDRLLQFSFIYLPFAVLAIRDLRRPALTFLPMSALQRSR